MRWHSRLRAGKITLGFPTLHIHPKLEISITAVFLDCSMSLSWLDSWSNLENLTAVEKRSVIVQESSISIGFF